ncbi:ATP-binding protein [Conexibacter stalactiti]|uniref:histidine kinase n=1 Tax=Conexibacter stalactiti TaxID=1940611 RepID=A0ABU4HHT7_9ACTN|nr:ATP-binding protein [Conexibacter stalactiti]MDW5592876.1 ATP-binding protein [Conexibacter stalactiti]MEC5033517.1 ATP-binding protein [Conexibacter stalactiti]
MQEAVEAERAQTRAWLHDSVLQVLEYLASGGYADEPDARELARIAADAATELRAYVEGEDPDRAARGEGELCARLLAAVEEERALADHEIGLVFGEFETPVEGWAAEQLALAAREALRNTRKHARATRALVTADVVGGAATVIVSDDGAGFVVGAVRRGGAGLRESIVGRLARAGGHAGIRSRPGHGTRVTLRLPLTDAQGDATPGAERDVDIDDGTSAGRAA